MNRIFLVLCIVGFLIAEDNPGHLPAVLHSIKVDKATPRELDNNLADHLVTHKLLIARCGEDVIRKFPEVSDLLGTQSKQLCDVYSGGDFYYYGNRKTELIEKVFQEGYRPLVLRYIKAMNLVDAGDYRTAIGIFEEILVRLKETGESDEFSYLCLKKLIRLTWDINCQKDGIYSENRVPKERLPEFFSLIVKIIKSRKFDFYAGDRQLSKTLLEVLGTDSCYNELPYPGVSDALIRELENAEKTWLTLAIRGACYLNKAWVARGGGFANGVKDESWPIFHKYLGLARGDFEKAYALNPRLAVTSDLMIAVSMSEGRMKEDQRLWFDRALAAERDRRASFYRFFFALTPRWGGSLQLIQSVGEEALATKDYSSLLPYRYLDAIYFIKDDATSLTTQEEKRQQMDFFTSKSTVASTIEVFDGYGNLGNGDYFPKDYANFNCAYIVGVQQGKPSLGKEILEKNGMNYITTSRHMIDGKTPEALYAYLSLLIGREAGKSSSVPNGNPATEKRN